MTLGNTDRRTAKPGTVAKGAAPRAEDLSRALKHCEAVRAKCEAYKGTSEHMRRKLEAAVRSAEYDVAILRYAIQDRKKRNIGGG